MDDAADRLNLTDIRALARCRLARERRAMAILQARLRICETANAARDAVTDELDHAEARRAERESAVYDHLTGRRHSAAELEAYWVTVTRQSERLAAVADRLVRAKTDCATAERRAGAARRSFLEQVRQSNKSQRIEERIARSRNRRLAAVEELQIEDEIADTRRGPDGGGRS